MNAPLLAVENLVVCRGAVEVISGISLEVADGSITCVVGPNGAGKTSLMLAIAGLLRPRRGSLRFAGSELAGEPPHRILGRGIALVPQEREIFDGLSVRENLLAGAYRRRDREAVARDLDGVLARFPRLAERSDQDAATLSGGEQQMLSIARALMSVPKLLLLDEPTSGLAPLMVAHLFRLICEINNAGVAVLVVEQTVPPALRSAGHVYRLERGRLTSCSDGI